MKNIPNLTNNHIALWKCIRNRTQENETCSKAVIRDDLRTIGFDVDKKFSRWLNKLEGSGLIFINRELIIFVTKI